MDGFVRELVLIPRRDRERDSERERERASERAREREGGGERLQRAAHDRSWFFGAFAFSAIIRPSRADAKRSSIRSSGILRDKQSGKPVRMRGESPARYAGGISTFAAPVIKFGSVVSGD